MALHREMTFRFCMNRIEIRNFDILEREKVDLNYSKEKNLILLQQYLSIHDVELRKYTSVLDCQYSFVDKVIFLQ